MQSQRVRRLVLKPGCLRHHAICGTAVFPNQAYPYMRRANRKGFASGRFSRPQMCGGRKTLIIDQALDPAAPVAGAFSVQRPQLDLRRVPPDVRVLEAHQ